MDKNLSRDDDRLKKANPGAEKSKDCSSFRAAINRKLTNNNKGLDETGLFTVMCAPHEVPIYSVDLRTGERYAYLDEIMKRVLEQWPQNKIFLFYDIACLYTKHFRQFSEQDVRRVVHVVPKFHVAAHVIKCRRTMHPALTPGCRQIDGEGCERLWSKQGKLAPIVRSMRILSRKQCPQDAAF
ncbi:hypothetical protein BC831DRAFT_179627 [Entophlyctis helioformis]|nr:hypothetical protein BC831DRAFT_179627 [Entophlyctis helioformis]